ncbi:uncharacterized protein [Chironomus tepperi]|uniref:uncharacterized protein isoform X2 n=1 Tax=Chironomus tepperi TaxID=113505 RepID=UPI00391F9C37
MCVYNVLIVFAVLCVTKTINCVDWTLNCSIGCHCKWMNGKKSALCNSLNLTQLPVNLSTEIQVLMMNENNIQTLNREEFTTLGMINLQKIFLKKSNIKYLHRETFKDLKILVELDLSENQIEQLDKQTFAGNDRLRILLLYGNPIKKLIADQFPSLPYLRTIDLHSCDIFSIDETTFSNVELLEYLDLKQNQLQNLPGLVFNHMKNLKTLLLDENPWNCDCKLKNFRNWYVKNNLNRISLQCKSPYSLLDQHWENIHEDAFGCAPILKILNEDVSLSDLESNITFKCYTTGDPPPKIGWYLDGKEIDNDNVVIDNDDPMHSNNDNPSLPQVSSVAINSNNIAVSGINNNIISINNINNNNNNNINNNNIHGNSNGYASQNVSLLLPEVGYEHVLIKNNDNFWYFGLVVGIFGTITFFLLISIVFCVCRKVAMRRRIKKNIKGSVSFNDQEKKLLDLSITTTNDRDRDYGDMLNTPSSATNKTDSSIIALEPVQITIENFHHPHNLQHHLQQHHRRMGDEYNPYNQSIALFPPPPPEFCTSAATTQSSLSAIAAVPTSTTSSSIINGQLYQQEQHLRHNLPPIVANATGNSVQNSSNQPPYGNIFISVSLTQDSLDNELNMYPDLLNIVPNRIKNSSTANNLSTSLSSSLQQSSTNVSSAIAPTSQIVPINIESYATLPRNKLLNSGTSKSGPVSILKNTKRNYDKPRMFETDVDCMAGLIISSSGVSTDINNKCVSCSFKSDNMGLRVTASGNTTIGGTATSSLSIPDEELEDEEELQNHECEKSNHHLTSAPYHHQTEEFEQLSPPPPPKASQQPATGAIHMPNDFVSL